MNDFTVNEMLAMQQKLQEKYQDKWAALTPEIGKNQLLWMVGEIGEVIDIVKKNGGTKAAEDPGLEKIWSRNWQMCLCTIMIFYYAMESRRRSLKTLIQTNLRET